MNDQPTPMPVSQRIVQICLYLIAAIALLGGSVQMYLGEPETTARLDNVHRFMAGVYFSCGLISFWAASTVRKHNTLVFLIALAAFTGGLGRLLSMSTVGIPEPAGLWLGYLTPELLVPVIIVVAQWMTNRKLAEK